MGVVEEPAPLEPAHHAEDLAILLALGPHHELRRGAGRRDARAALEPRLPRQAAGQHQVREEVARVVLLPRQRADDRVVRSFEVHRHARGQARGLHHLLRLRAGQQLDVHIAGEALASPQDLDGGQHPVHRARARPGTPEVRKRPCATPARCDSMKVRATSSGDSAVRFTRPPQKVGQ